VRRGGLDTALKELGADHVLLDDASLVGKVKEICGNNLPRLASNAVGGDSALRQMDALGELGTQVTYGAMSLRSLKVPNKFLIFKGIHLRGLWITKWIAAAKPEQVAQVYQQLAQWVVEGKLKQSIEKCYPPNQLLNALERSQQMKRDGKILLDWQELSNNRNEQ
jgi:NADPH:quinone reductase-like Zn-dependent oxidoreductase